MLRKTDELRYWQESEVVEVLSGAYACVQLAGLPQELYVVGFQRAAELLGQKHVVMENLQLGAPVLAIPGGVE